MCQTTAIFIKTAPGRKSLSWTINSIKCHFEGREHRIYISDEPPLDSWKVALYEELEAEGHCIDVSERNRNVGYARNQLLDRLRDETQILRLDDDFELGGEFDFDALEAVLWSSADLAFCSDLERQIGEGKGVISGNLRPKGGFLYKKDGLIVKRFHGVFYPTKKTSSYHYSKANFTRNLILLKRRIIETVRWDEELLFEGEHLDLMLSIQAQGYWGAYTLDSIHLHRDDLSKYRNQHSYQRNQDSKEAMLNRFMTKWGCTSSRTKYGVSWYIYEACRRVFR